MMTTRTVMTLAILSLCESACTRTSEPEALARSQQSLTAATANVVPGYVHSIDQSRFRIGSSPAVEVDAPNVRRWRGSLGAFTLDPTNGAVSASLDATSPRGQYVLDESAHGTNVRAYFVAAGLPTDQIGEIQTTYMSGMMGGKMGDTPAPPTLESINSILRRRINGILVPESEAWAKMTTGGDVDMEFVFWPPIQQSVVNAAVALSSQLADANAHAAFIAKLPGGKIAKEVGVVIHHSDASIHAPPQGYVSFDAVVDSIRGAPTRHFDPTGAEFQLPQEVAMASTKRR